MEIGSLYNTAKNFAETLKHSRPELTNYDACLCLIVADSGDIYSGVSSVSINEGTVNEVPAERIAVMSAITAKHVIAKQLIVISLDDYSYFKPEDEAISLLVNASVDNGSCQVVLSPDETATAASLAPASAVSDFLSGYDETPEQLGAPAEFASGFDVDSTNPFNNGESDNKADSLNSLYEHPEEAQQMGASGFPNVYAQQGYPQQQQGFPQQQGYPQQQGFPQQGYPQQGFPQPAPYGGGMQNSMYQQNMNAAPYRQGYTGQSLHGGSMYQQQPQQSVSVTLTSKPSGESAFKKRLNNFLGDDDDVETGDSMSKEDMLKQAKDRKKVAKANLNFKKKM